MCCGYLISVLMVFVNFSVHTIYSKVNYLLYWLSKVIRKLHKNQQNATAFSRFERMCLRYMYAPGSYRVQSNYKRYCLLMFDIVLVFRSWFHKMLLSHSEQPKITSPADDRIICLHHLWDRFLAATTSTNVVQGRR